MWFAASSAWRVNISSRISASRSPAISARSSPKIMARSSSSSSVENWKLGSSFGISDNEGKEDEQEGGAQHREDSISFVSEHAPIIPYYRHLSRLIFSLWVEIVGHKCCIDKGLGPSAPALPLERARTFWFLSDHADLLLQATEQVLRQLGNILREEGEIRFVRAHATELGLDGDGDPPTIVVVTNVNVGLDETGNVVN